MSARKSRRQSKEKPSPIYPWKTAKPLSVVGGMQAKSVAIDAENAEAAAEMRQALSILCKLDETVTRSLEQNDCLHAWFRTCATRWNELGCKPRMREETMKYYLTIGLGNVVVAPPAKPGGPQVVTPVSTTTYAHTPDDLTEVHKRVGFISMQEFMAEIEAWAARELMLDLETGQPIEDVA